MMHMTLGDIYRLLNYPSNEAADKRTLSRVTRFHDRTLKNSVYILIPHICEEELGIAEDDAVDQAFSTGAIALIAEKNYPQYHTIVVPNARAAQRAIAQLNRERNQLKVIGITGSNGKTTTKELTHLILSSNIQYSHARKTSGNANALIHTADQLLGIIPNTEVLVLEFGMGKAGVVEEMSRIATPDIGVITTVGVSHIGNFEDPYDIFRAKMEILTGMTEQSILLLNADNQYLGTVKQEDIKPRLMRLSARDPSAEFYASDVKFERNQLSFTAHYQSVPTRIQIDTLGIHNVINVLASFAIGRLMNVPAPEIASTLRRFVPQGIRQNIQKYGSITVILDCFNSSPESIRAGIEYMLSYDTGFPGGRKIAILGDMGGFGDWDEKYHRQVGQMFKDYPQVDLLYCVGKRCKWMAEEAEKVHPNVRYMNKEELVQTLKADNRPGDLLFVKGGRMIKLETAIREVFMPKGKRITTEEEEE